MENDATTLYRNVKEIFQDLETVSVSFHFDKTLKMPPFRISEYVPGQLAFEHHYVNRPMTLTTVSSIDLKKTGDDTNEPFFTGIDFLPDGRLVAVDNYNTKCIVYNEKLEKVGSYQLSHVPKSIAAVSEEDVVITSGSGYIIEFLHISKCNEITSDRTYKVKTKYDSICLKDDDQFVVGTINDKRHVRIVSMTGNENDFSVSFPTKKYTINASSCTYNKNNDILVLTDRYEHAVYIYDTKSDTRVVVKDDQIEEPRGVAVGPSDTILVCSKGTNSIVQISQTGHILSSHKIDMIYPLRVCVSRDKSFLVVINNHYKNKKMQKFKIS
jgi:sugar lactone lactonase YvrE